MKFGQFEILNFKGIEKLTFDLDKSPEANIYTLVGLNESGKTTILEAINIFNSNDNLSFLDIPGSIIKDLNNLIPISKRDNFNGKITIKVKILIDQSDLVKINEFVKTNTSFRKVRPISALNYTRQYVFVNSQYKEYNSTWDGFYGVLKSVPIDSYIPIFGSPYLEENLKLARFCSTLIPSILYFPSFFFEFPSKILLETEKEPTLKETFYIELIQDILFSLNNGTDVKTHLVGRIKSSEVSDKRSLDRLIQLMEKKVSEEVFNAWNTIFRRKITDTKIIINYDRDENGFAYLEFQIEASDGIYQINERSLGFRWFFMFLLFTQFRPFRQNAPKNVIFLFDEPASNLHSSAQKQLLESFEKIIGDCKIIYTTHSHHLINPKWLESTYVVKNEGLKLEDPDIYNIRETNIRIESYRDFVTKHPHNTAYFQPILDVLDYRPSNLENLPNCIFLEGKNDFYILSYFQNIIFKAAFTFNFTPSTGSGNLDTLISLYIGWTTKFMILLDSDKEGKKQKERYVKNFGILVEKVIFTLEDINPSWKDFEMEDLFEKSDLISFQQTCYPVSVEFNKTHFNRAIQENLTNKIYFQFSGNTIANFNVIFQHLTKEIKALVSQ
ncbi:AAA family ATPase [Flavitalea sp. BT771]|uniref:ATP-dependent nuclease n=1 Tax=Flavitalea sp. BT771 TaxID=3063329 RepID=UPI0026E2340D|nr:AAA family ATPase [Flavitalea sp. BT771]MDO6433084.1 AAA family ATPase [Flavitalea sp. BT771]MDV6221640.1 AAA family ATPase [Flavitalea sp. BT771]